MWLLTKDKWARPGNIQTKHCFSQICERWGQKARHTFLYIKMSARSCLWRLTHAAVLIQGRSGHNRSYKWTSLGLGLATVKQVRKCTHLTHLFPFPHAVRHANCWHALHTAENAARGGVGGTRKDVLQIWVKIGPTVRLKLPLSTPHRHIGGAVHLHSFLNLALDGG
jgi:hypothetical protein